MSTRVVEGKKPYTGGEAIDINEDKVISLKLRDENNLIIYDEGDDEIYVDLQLSNEIEPTDAFPVGVNTGRVIVDNGWDKTGTLISAKTTSGDNIQLLYADDGTLWIDNGTGTFKQIYFKGDVDDIVATLTEYIDAHDTVVSDTAPSDPYEGELWYDTVNDTLKVYNGNTWVATGGGGGGSGDVVGPSSATDGHLAVFDGATGKLIKDGGPVPTGGAEIEYKTQAEYNALLPGALTDNKHYFIYTSDTPTPPTPWQPGANTVVYYPLDSVNTVNDLSGNNYTLTNSNVTFGTNAGVDCASFSSSSTRLEGVITTIPTGASARTFSWWFYLNGYSSSWGNIFMKYGTDNTRQNWYPYIGNSSNHYFGLGMYDDIEATTPCSTGTWYNFVCVYNGTDCILYVNGQQIDSGAKVLDTQLSNLTIGGAGGNYINGYMSQLIIEDVAWTSTEVSDYYDQTKANYGIS